MFELLSKDRRHKLRRDYALRFIAATLILFAIVGIVWIVVLTPSVYISYLRAQTLEHTAQSLQQSATNKTTDSNHLDSIGAVKAVAEIASSTPAHPTFIIDAVERLKGTVDISTVSADRIGETRTYSVILSGTARNRIDVVVFGERLKGEEWVESLDVPISNLVKEQEVPFSMTIQTKDVPYVKSKQ